MRALAERLPKPSAERDRAPGGGSRRSQPAIGFERLLVVVALVTACHGGHARHDDAGPAGSASPVSELVPRLPPSPDPREEIEGIDVRVGRLRSQPREVGVFLATLLERASIRGDLEDYQEAIARSAKWVEEAPGDAAAWRARVQVLTRVHQFAGARAALEKWKKLARDPSEWQDTAATLDEATGHLERSQPVRDEIAKTYPSTINLVLRAGGLGVAGRLDEALALMPKAAAALHDNSPELLTWIYFQWGRLYELKGEMASAREFFAAARQRLPTLEATTHLAQATAASGDEPGARKVVDEALAKNRNPELLGLAAQLGHPELVAEARTAWERYVAALPEAFADHAARFYLAAGKDPTRALELAKKNLANRDTHEARALVVEAALAAGDGKTACEAAEPLIASGGLRSERFAAWKALSACGRKDEADRLARELGITK
jgi:tetratricopeptide (TPR) repeat protein